MSPYKELWRKQQWEREWKRRNYNPNDEGDLCPFCMKRFRRGAGYISHELWEKKQQRASG